MGKIIVVVDDDPGLILVVSGFLEKEGFEVVCFNSGEECLEKLEKIKPDLILMDIMMPGIDGWKTLEEIRKTKVGKSLPVAMLTARADVSEVMFAMNVEGVADYITKPFESDELVQRIKKILQRESK